MTWPLYMFLYEIQIIFLFDSFVSTDGLSFFTTVKKWIYFSFLGCTWRPLFLLKAFHDFWWWRRCRYVSNKKDLGAFRCVHCAAVRWCFSHVLNNLFVSWSLKPNKEGCFPSASWHLIKKVVKSSRKISSLTTQSWRLDQRRQNQEMGPLLFSAAYLTNHFIM